MTDKFHVMRRMAGEPTKWEKIAETDTRDLAELISGALRESSGIITKVVEAPRSLGLKTSSPVHPGDL